jgi:hypothetical protein
MVIKHLASTAQQATCTSNISQYMKFNVFDGNGGAEQYALIAVGDVAKVDGRGAAAGVHVPLYTYIGKDLQAACAAPTHTSALQVCADTGEEGANCPPPLPCEFDGPGFTFLGDPVKVGGGSIRLGRYNFGQSGLSAFAGCAQANLSTATAAELSGAPIQTSSASRAVKPSLAIGALVAVSVALSALQHA